MNPNRNPGLLLAGDRVAAGVTGRTTAELTAQYTLIHDHLRRTRGPEGARLYARSQTEAIEYAAGLVDALGIDCGWEEAAALTCAEDPRHVAELRAEAEPRGMAGLPAEFVTGTDLPFAVAHLGCVVAFNDAEQAWECPCHGSRFAPDGRILQGPAVRPLEKRDIPQPEQASAES
ncbi:FAD-dependent oxidoreductase [Streptomyces sp. AK08-02]|uniref:FAD-dependent oxidoreductase n=1 Tax=Streptomyces sp. AK08-02 TaxID=3028654 RepID=UPI0029C07D79|nr:FAD-dependent oxidoreductase [Streptomyces sp. AK08-02]